MNVRLSLFTLAAFSLPAVASAQLGEKDPGFKPDGTPVRLAEISQKLDLKDLGNDIYGAAVCMSSLTLDNTTAVQKQVDKSVFKPGSGASSVVEVLQPGDSLNILDRGEAGDNILDEGMAGDNFTIYRFDHGDTLELNASFGGDGDCRTVGILFTAPGERVTATFAIPGDEAAEAALLGYLAGDGDVGLGFKCDLSDDVSSVRVNRIDIALTLGFKCDLADDVSSVKATTPGPPLGFKCDLSDHITSFKCDPSDHVYGVRVNRIDMTLVDFPEVELKNVSTDADGVTTANFALPSFPRGPL